MALTTSQIQFQFPYATTLLCWPLSRACRPWLYSSRRHCHYCLTSLTACIHTLRQSLHTEYTPSLVTRSIGLHIQALTTVCSKQQTDNCFWWPLNHYFSKSPAFTHGICVNCNAGSEATDPGRYRFNPILRLTRSKLTKLANKRTNLIAAIKTVFRRTLIVSQSQRWNGWINLRRVVVIILVDQLVII